MAEVSVVRYSKGYRFQLAEPFTFITPITEACAGNHWVGLSADGAVTCAAGYAWDGASGPIRQGPEIVRGSLVHDALYQLMREHGLSHTWRKAADSTFRDLIRADGMGAVMTFICYTAVRAFGDRFIRPDAARPVLTAPDLPTLALLE